MNVRFGSMVLCAHAARFFSKNPVPAPRMSIGTLNSATRVTGRYPWPAGCRNAARRCRWREGIAVCRPRRGNARRCRGLRACASQAEREPPSRQHRCTAPLPVSVPLQWRDLRTRHRQRHRTTPLPRAPENQHAATVVIRREPGPELIARTRARIDGGRAGRRRRDEDPGPLAQMSVECGNQV